MPRTLLELPHSNPDPWVQEHRVSLLRNYLHPLRAAERSGALWRFDMIAPDGRRYPSRMQVRRIEPPTLIEFDHGAGNADDPGRFRTTITFDEQSDGQTVITCVSCIQPKLNAMQASVLAQSNTVTRRSKSSRAMSNHCVQKRLQRDRCRPQFRQSRKRSRRVMSCSRD